jgi:GntR family phosphonate transport system transcriptional regulator
MTAPPLRQSPDDVPLQRGEGIAAWRQIVDELEADMAAGRLAAGSQLPTEARLSERFGVNRHTVRRAIAVLASRGLVRATQGRGTFVEARPLAYPIGPRTRFSEVVSGAGREPSGECVSARETEADPATAEALGIAPGAPVIEMAIVHRADGTPLSTASLRLPLPRFAGFDRHFVRLGSITKALRACGVEDYSRASTRIGARPCGPEEARRLDLAPGRIVLVVDSVNVDAAGCPVQATRSFFAADRVELVVEPPRHHGS